MDLHRRYAPHGPALAAQQRWNQLFARLSALDGDLGTLGSRSTRLVDDRAALRATCALVFDSMRQEHLPWTTGTHVHDPNVVLAVILVTGYVIALQTELRNACAG